MIGVRKVLREGGGRDLWNVRTEPRRVHSRINQPCPVPTPRRESFVPANVLPPHEFDPSAALCSSQANWHAELPLPTPPTAPSPPWPGEPAPALTGSAYVRSRLVAPHMGSSICVYARQSAEGTAPSNHHRRARCDGCFASTSGATRRVAFFRRWCRTAVHTLSASAIDLLSVAPPRFGRSLADRNPQPRASTFRRR